MDKTKTTTSFSGQKTPNPSFLEKHYILVFPPATFIPGSASALMSQAPQECSDPFPEIPGKSKHSLLSPLSLCPKELPSAGSFSAAILSLGLSSPTVTDVLRTPQVLQPQSPFCPFSCCHTKHPFLVFKEQQEYLPSNSQEKCQFSFKPQSKTCSRKPWEHEQSCSLLRNQDVRMKWD